MRISDWSSDVCSSDLFFEGVLAMSSRDEQARWTAFYSKDNPKSPQSVFTDLDTVFIAIKSVTFVSTNVAQIRFTKTLQHGAITTDTPAIATVTYDTTDTPTTEQQRFKNPQGQIGRASGRERRGKNG